MNDRSTPVLINDGQRCPSFILKNVKDLKKVKEIF